MAPAPEVPPAEVAVEQIAPPAPIAVVEKPVRAVSEPETLRSSSKSDPETLRTSGGKSEPEPIRTSSSKSVVSVVQAPPPSVVAEAAPKKSGSNRTANPNNNNATAPKESSGSQRRKVKDQTKPVSTVVPANQIGLVPADRSTALGLKAEEFRAKSKNARTDQEILDLCMDDHASMCATLSARKTHVAAVRAMWNKDSVWKAVTQMKESKDLSVVVDVFQTLSSQQLQIVPLEVLNVLLTEMQCLLQSEYEDYVILGCSMLRQVNKIFCPVLKATRESKPADVRSDPVLAERIEVSNTCWDTLGKCSLQLKENLGCGGRVSSSSREVLALFRRVGL